MTIIQSFLLGVLQGITEFLPISSSGHLVLLEHMLDLKIDQAVLQSFDIILHAGTLLAIFIYFYRTWFSILRHPCKKESGQLSLLMFLIIATVPVGIVGVLLKEWIEQSTRTPQFVAGGFFITATLFLICSFFLTSKKTSYFTWKQAIIMGITQAIAIVPGCSRSGWTLAGGILSGMDKVRATQTAFLMGLPALSGALVYVLLLDFSLIKSIDPMNLIVGFVSAFLSSILVMHFFLQIIRRYGLWIWSVYLYIASALILFL